MALLYYLYYFNFLKMNKTDLLKKKELAEQLGMKFEEASELFSDETLETMRMNYVVGGELEPKGLIDICPNACPNACPEVDGCLNTNCPCPPLTQEPPPEMNWKDCPIDITFPPPPVVAQDALCGVVPPVVTTP